MFDAACKHLKSKTKTVRKLRYNFEGVNKFIKIQSLSILRTSYKTYQLSKDEQWPKPTKRPLKGHHSPITVNNLFFTSWNVQYFGVLWLKRKVPFKHQ